MGHRCYVIVTGTRIPPQHWNDDLRLRVAMTFDELQVDVPGVLDGKTESDVRSRWLFPAGAVNSADPEIPF